MGKNTRTTWTSPTANIIIAVNQLRKYLASGYKARLIRIFNEDCEHPILLNKNELSTDFREYEFGYATLRTKAEILADTSMSNFEKKLSLEFHNCYGDEESMKQYYETGILTEGNFRGMGRSHLVRVSDMVDYLLKSDDKKDIEYAKVWEHYSSEEDKRHFYDDFHLKSAQYRTPKHFNHKLYAIEMLDKDSPAIVNKWFIRALIAIITIVTTPLKYIPQKSILRMPEYTNYSFRVGSVVHGYRIEFQIPKKFNFKDRL